MIPTERLYFRDSSLLEFTGTVIDIRSSDGGDSVVLDRTAFYPTGGGQPNDLGTLSDVEVSDVSYDGCQIRSDDKFKKGEVVELRIIKRGAIEGEVRWSANGRAGVCFVGKADEIGA